MKLISVNRDCLGSELARRIVTKGIFKERPGGRVALRKLNAGRETAGGPDRAWRRAQTRYCTRWRTSRPNGRKSAGRNCRSGMFGENFTLDVDAGLLGGAEIVGRVRSIWATGSPSARRMWW